MDEGLKEYRDQTNVEATKSREDHDSLAARAILGIGAFLLILQITGLPAENVGWFLATVIAGVAAIILLLLSHVFSESFCQAIVRELDAGGSGLEAFKGWRYYTLHVVNILSTVAVVGACGALTVFMVLRALGQGAG